MLKIAHLILCHTDFEHIERLVRRLVPISDVFIHVDKNVDDRMLRACLEKLEGCYFVDKRFHCNWGAWNAVEAEMQLIQEALDHGKYDRVVFLQGADYPIKSNESIVNFYRENETVEFIRGCQVSGSNNPYFWPKCRYILFRNNPNIVKKGWNFACNKLHIKLRDGWIEEGGEKYPVFWGGALWALTGACAAYVLQFYKEHQKFNRWFYYAFAPDELYIVTVVMNSQFRERTCKKGPEAEKAGTANWRCLHVWEYLPGSAKIYTANDFEDLTKKEELYVRKVNSEKSTDLLNMLDQINE